MNNLIVTIIFGILTIVFITGIVIMIRNRAKIKAFNKAIRQRLKEELPLKVVHVKWQLTKPLVTVSASKIKLIK